jgi:hypothetical protein
MKHTKIKHPTEKEIETFYHERTSVSDCAWVTTHLTSCRRCSRKFQKLKEKQKFRHKGTKFAHNYKSLDLLWIIQPETAERMATCLAASTFAHWRLDEVSIVEEMEYYSNALLMLKDCDIKNPEKYLNYKNIDEAWTAFDYAAQWLARMEIAQRFDLFVTLASTYIISWSDDLRESPVYIKNDSISHMAGKLGIPEEMAWKITEEELWNLQEYWKHRDKGEEWRDSEYRSMDLLRRTAPEVADRITCCFATMLFITEELSSISTWEEMMNHMEALETLRELSGKVSEKSLTYKNDEEALSAFEGAARWLTEKNVKERFWLFKKLTTIIGNRFVILEKTNPYPRLTDVKKIRLFCDTLGIPKDLFDNELDRLKNMLLAPFEKE